MTGRSTEEQPAALAAALTPLRQNGVRLAVDHTGSYFNSIRHIRHLKPDIIKLDRPTTRPQDWARSSHPNPVETGPDISSPNGSTWF
jgi:EAL domain-containing protein (putative c-di-GMP-specific phosphodiesterase class I)